MLALRKPTQAALDRIVREQSAASLTYPEVGATAGTLPPGYQHIRAGCDLGPFDDARFAAAAGALLRWQAQRGAGLTVSTTEPAAVGMTFALAMRLPPGYATITGRVVLVADEPDCRGFAYGTLPRHPETGEEAFMVIRERDRIVFRVTAFSRPRHPLARLGGPVTRALQRALTQRYLAAMRQAVP